MKLFFLLIVLIGPSLLRSQTDTVTLSLNDCIRMGQENGPLAAMARAAYSGKEHRYHSFTARFYPQLSLSADAPQFIRTISPITQPDGTSSFLSQRQAQSSLSLALVQQIPWTGTEISIYSGLNRLDNLETNALFYRSTPLSISLRQPLFTINTLAWNYELEDLNYQSSHREFVEQMEESAIDITNKFFAYYLAKMNVSNAQLNLTVNDTLFQVSKGRFNVGKIAENDLLQSELAALNARTQYENAVIEYDRALQNLRYAVGLTSQSPVHVVPDESIYMFAVDPATALELARENRSDMVNYRVQKLNAERSVRQAESNNSISMSISANVGLNQKANAVKDAYADLLDQQQFSVQLQVPLIGWGTGSHAVEAAEAELSRVETNVLSQRFSLEQEVKYQVQRFKQLQQQVLLSAKADTVAQRRFDVARERFVIGKIDVTNLFLAQSEKDNAYRTRIQTLWDYWATYYRLRRLTLYDFAMQRPLLVKD